jgi:DNA-binding transcriptional LysR family regulator
MEIDAVKIFLDVMRAGSFASVARLHGVDPSSISRTIVLLEEQLGFRLFQRTTRRLVATEPGNLYFERIQPLIDEIERARDEARDVVAEPSGRLRITASVAFGTTCLVPLLPRFRSVHPELELDLLLSDTVLDLIAERVDLAIRLGPRLDTGFVGTQLMRTRYRVCASPSYVARAAKLRRPQDLAAHDCLLFPFPGYRTLWKFRDKRGGVVEVPVKGSIVISNALALLRAAQHGGGPVLLADWLVGASLKDGSLLDLFPGHDVSATDFETAAWILYPSRAYMPRKLRAGIDFLKANIGSA